MMEPHSGHSLASSGFSLSSMMVQRDHSSTDDDAWQSGQHQFMPAGTNCHPCRSCSISGFLAAHLFLPSDDNPHRARKEETRKCVSTCSKSYPCIEGSDPRFDKRSGGVCVCRFNPETIPDFFRRCAAQRPVYELNGVQYRYPRRL